MTVSWCILQVQIVLCTAPFFSTVGSGNGDYIEDGFTANGRIYKWIAPDTINSVIIRNGDHAPLRLLVTPKRRQMVNGGGTIQFSDDHYLTFEAAFSNRDLNTFSTLDGADDGGLALWTDWGAKKKLGEKQEVKAGVRVFHEYVQQSFTEIERWRSVEFDRDWNIRGLELSSDQNVAGASVSIEDKNAIKASVEGAFLVREALMKATEGALM